MNHTVKIIMTAVLVCVLSLAMVGCDMEYIFGPPSIEEDGDNGVIVITPDERDVLERTGRFLKLINMPLNTQTPNISATSVANAVSSIGKIDTKKQVKIFQEETTSTVYIPLVYSNGTEFVENGMFYVIFTVNVDALTRIVVTKPDNVLVSFTSGRGELDVLSLPKNTLPDIWPGDGDDENPAGGDNEVITPDERDELERTGRFLKLINMPPNTQTPNIVTTSVANAASTIARMNPKAAVKIFMEETTVTVYIPLVYSNGTEFIETGAFHVMTVIHIDSLTRIIITKQDNVLVSFTDGRGELDILALPKGTLPDIWPGDGDDNEVITPDERDELERTGRFLKLTNLPPNTQSSNVVTASVANAASTIARIDARTAVKIFREETTVTVYIPLVYSNGTEFTETGIFYVIFSVRVDALTQFVAARLDNVLVSFSEGRGELNILTLPNLPGTLPGDDNDPGGGGTVIIPPDDEEELKRTERYLLLYHLPQSARGEFLSSLNISDGSRSVARVDTSRNYAVAVDSSFANMYVPLLAANSAEFTRTGSFYVSFEIRIDALTRIAVRSDHRVIVEFTEGRGTLDVEDIVKRINGTVVPEETEDPEKNKIEEEIEKIITTGGYIRFFNLPRNVSKTKISAVSVSNNDSVIARCADYETIAVRKSTLTSEAFVPLTSTRFSTPFTETGSYYTSFSIIIDALTSIVTDPNNPPMLSFEDGVLNYDVLRLPPPLVPPPRAPHALTITNLPESANITNLADVFVWNQSGKVAKCADYTKITVSPLNGKEAALIPLVYDNSPQFNGTDFADSGSFLVTFSFFPDISTSIVVTAANNCVATFSNGSANVNIETIPAIPHNYLTITNLPPQLPLSGVSNVFVWNQAGKIAQCEDYNLLSISSTQTAATVRIPLCYTNSKSIFTNTGSYFVSFDINADALNRITITEKDAVAVIFTAGNGTLNATTLPAPEPPTYLTITGLPPQLPRSGVSNVFVRNQTGRVAQCDDYNALVISNSQTSSTVKIPLSTDSRTIFTDSGNYYVSFEINADAINRIIVTKEDAVTVTFTSGNGTFNVNTLPSLTITNLPPQVTQNGVSNVFVRNQAGRIAQCDNYNLLGITNSQTSSTVRIPLNYTASKSIFTGSGDYFVTFDINADALNRITVTDKDAVTVHFTSGNGTLNASALPGIPCLTLTGLPSNTFNTHFSDVSVYGPTGKVARHSSVNDISVTRNSSSATARVPLVYVSNGDYFRETGSFYVTFTITIDLNTYIIINQENPIRLNFQNGSASHNMAQSLGYFSGALTNPSDTAAPIVKRDTTFEINGTFYNISADTPVNTVVTFSSSTMVYIYAVQRYNGVDFEYSTTPPAFSTAKNGYYSGDKRALWKMFLYKETTDYYYAKTLISDRFTHLSYYTVNSANIPVASPLHSLSGDDNPAPATVTLQEGVYLFKLSGAGGAAGGTFTTATQSQVFQGGSGSQGGAVAELVFVGQPAEFSLFTGQGGKSGNPSQFKRAQFSQDGPLSIYAVTAPGGGGGGSGSFIYSDNGYFLCAGGGGGGSAAGGPSGSSFPFVKGGAGGAGGSIGPGANGGQGPSYTTTATSLTNFVNGELGGYGGVSTFPTPAGIMITHYGFASESGSQAAYCRLDPPFSWKNTNNANGTGADAVVQGPTPAGVKGNDGISGGNNRNTSKGGGASGSTANGAAGSIVIYKLY